jgi:hypothetical protein
MHACLTPLPQALVRQLGQWQAPAPLAQALVQAARLPAPEQNAHSLAQHLRQHRSNQTCLSLNGMDVLLHRAPDTPSGTAAEPIWGLHSVCWHTGAASAACWTGAWPEGMDPHTIGAAQLVQLLAHDPQQALIAPGMVCFEVDGHDARRWALMGLFDPSGPRLHSLHLSRLGDWLPTAPVAPAQSPSSTA